MKSIILFIFNLLVINAMAQKSLNFKTGDAIPFEANNFNFKIIPLQTNDNCVLGLIYEVRVTDNYFYLLDGATNTIFKFNKSGRYISKINAFGLGPGKYSNVSHIQINPYNQQIEVVDNYKNTIFKYTNQGKIK